MKTAIFCWDWKEQAPVGEIVSATAKIKNAKAWCVCDGSDTYTVIIAATKREARKANIAAEVACGCDADDVENYEITRWED